MLSCEMNVIKYILFSFNFIFALSGLGIILVGAFVISDVSEFNHFVEGRVMVPPVILIVTGAIVFIVASLGCFGAFTESRKLLIAFAVCLLVIFFLEIAVGIAAAIFKSDFQDSMKSALRTSMRNFGSSEADKQAWENVQSKLMCCGIDAPTDWYTDGPDRTLPKSCCHAINEGDEPPTEAVCRGARHTAPFVYQNGCYEKLQMKLKGSANTLVGVGIGIAFIEIIGIILAFWLASAIKREDEAKE